MERLTKRLENGQIAMNCEACAASWHKEHGEDVPFCTSLYCRNRLKDRLAAYEDSGLEPEKVVFLKDIVEDAFRDKPDFTNHLRDLLQAEQDGRLVVLPKPSDTDVYIVYYDECGAGGMCLDYPYCDDCKDHTPKIREAKLNCTMVNSIGKTVFLTQKEAEMALKGEHDG